VSTVLEAVRQQQRGAAGVTERTPPPNVRSWRPPWRLIVVMAVALVGVGLAVGVLLIVILRPDTRRTESPVTPATSPRVQAASEKAVLPAPSVAHYAATNELPRGHVIEKGLPPTQPTAVSKPKQAEQTRPHAEAPAKVSRAVDPSSLPGNTGVRLKSIHYVESSTKRTVTLFIGTEVATLHEGESVGGVEVQLILPDMVYIRNGGSVSAVAGAP
jgi:hypothetical protein